MFFSCPEYQSHLLDSHLDFSSLRGKSILITGANGMLPSALTEALIVLNEKLALNLKIIGMVRNLQKAKKRFNTLRSNQITLIEHDVSKQYENYENIDIIIHAASQASPKYYGVDPVGTLLPNVIGTHWLLETAKKFKSSFLFFSSGEVYGSMSSDIEVITEEYKSSVDQTSVRSCYAESKRMGENMCISYAHQYGIHTTIVRPFHVYGPGLLLDDGRVFADFVADAVMGRNITMHSDGTAIRAYCFLSDAVLGFLTVLLKGQSAQAYNIGNPNEQASVKELAEIVTGLVPEKKLTVEFKKSSSEYIPSPHNRVVPSVDKLMSLGWAPRVGIKEGFRTTIKSML